MFVGLFNSLIFVVLLIFFIFNESFKIILSVFNFNFDDCKFFFSKFLVFKFIIGDKDLILFSKEVFFIFIFFSFEEFLDLIDSFKFSFFEKDLFDEIGFKLLFLFIGYFILVVFDLL